jgi:hypothetical protein
VLAALVSTRGRAAAAPHWVASPLAVDRLLRSRPQLACVLSSLAQPQHPALPNAQLAAPTHAASPAAYVNTTHAGASAASVHSQLAAVVAQVLGAGVPADQPLIEVRADGNAFEPCRPCITKACRY